MLESEMRKALIKDIPEVFFQPIESGGVKVGIPDLYFFNRVTGRGGWAELKEINDHRSTVRIPWRPGQRSWLLSFQAKGGNGILICTSKHLQWWYVFKDLRNEYRLEELDQLSVHSSDSPSRIYFDHISCGN